MNFTAQGPEVVKWLFTEREKLQRSFDCPSCVADGVFIMCSDFQRLSSLCMNYARQARQCVQSLYKLAGGLTFSALAADTHDPYHCNLAMHW